MELILLPKSNDSGLESIYHRTLSKSVELYIVSAYLTHWEIEEKLGEQCKSFLFIVGTDFGLTRKAACQSVIDWLPMNRQAQFLAAESIEGFHPKAMFWREGDGKCYALVGSSNLSKAAFTTNHEANGHAEIQPKAFDAARAWLSSIEPSCVTLDAKWLENYREAVQPKKSGKPGAETKTEESQSDYAFDLKLPPVESLRDLTEILKQRRKQMRQFAQERAALEDLFRKSAAEKRWSDAHNLSFYEELNSRWFFPNGSRFQASGWERQGKTSNFQEFSKSFVSVLDAEDTARDQVVVNEVDRLTDLKVSTRRALFSEMLCQFFPKRYFVMNQPVSDWLATTGASKTRGASSGVRYIHSARLLRAALDRAKGYPAKNLAEVDALIWYAMRSDSY